MRGILTRQHPARRARPQGDQRQRHRHHQGRASLHRRMKNREGHRQPGRTLASVQQLTDKANKGIDPLLTDLETVMKQANAGLVKIEEPPRTSPTHQPARARPDAVAERAWRKSSAPRCHQGTRQRSQTTPERLIVGKNPNHENPSLPSRAFRHSRCCSCCSPWKTPKSIICSPAGSESRCPRQTPPSPSNAPRFPAYLNRQQPVTRSGGDSCQPQRRLGGAAQPLHFPRVTASNLSRLTGSMNIQAAGKLHHARLQLSCWK